MVFMGEDGEIFLTPSWMCEIFNDAHVQCVNGVLNDGLPVQI